MQSQRREQADLSCPWVHSSHQDVVANHLYSFARILARAHDENFLVTRKSNFQSPGPKEMELSHITFLQLGVLV
jgi:hypothetical protein